MSEELEFSAYHGTSKEKAVSICHGGFRKATKIGWLGCGSYFYDSDYDMALQYATCTFKDCQIKVVKCKLIIESNKVFDITNPLSNDYKTFNKIKTDIQKAIGAAKLAVRARAYWKFEANILERICNKYGYNLVRACTYSNNKIERSVRLPLPASKFANGIELCLKDISCIKDKKIV